MITVMQLYMSTTGHQTEGGGASLSDNQSEILKFLGDSKPGGVKVVTNSTAMEQIWA